MKPLLAVVSLSAGCAFLAHPKDAKYQRMVDSFEHAKPNAQQLVNNDLTETNLVIRNMGDWQGQIEGNAGADKKSMVERIEHSRHRYRVEAARLVGEPMKALALILPELETGTPDVLALLEQRAAEELGRRQADHDRRGTYHLPRDHQDVRSSTRIVNGQVVEASTSVRDEGAIGNCIVARRAFGPDHQPNPDLALVVHGAGPVWVRCFTEIDPPTGGALVAVLAGNFQSESIRLTLPAPGARHVDFQLPAASAQLTRGKPAGYVPIELVYVWAPDNVLVVDREGRLHVRPDWRRKVLAQGGLVRMTP